MSTSPRPSLTITRKKGSSRATGQPIPDPPVPPTHTDSEDSAPLVPENAAPVQPTSSRSFLPLFLSLLIGILGVSGVIAGSISSNDHLLLCSFIAIAVAAVIYFIDRSNPYMTKSQPVIPEKPQTLPVQQKEETPPAPVQSSGQQKNRKLFPGGASQIFAFLSFVCFCIALPSYVAAKTFDNPTFVDISAWALLGGLGFASACAGNDLGKKF